MFRLVFPVIVLFTISKSFAQKAVIHDANAEARNIGSFTAVSISGGVDLYLSQGNEDAVAVSANEIKYRNRIKTSVENNVLKIWYDGDGLNFKSGGKKMIAYVSFKSINKLSASGASDVYINGLIKGDELTIHLSGASDLKGRVQLNKLSINQSGASDATISGKTSIFEVEAAGASDLKGYDLETESCHAKASGASDIKITVNKELNASASGASSINYKGAGVVKELRSSGASGINKRS